MNKDRVRAIPKLSGQPKSICCECMKSKQVKNSHKKIQGINTTRPLNLLHMDLIGPMRTESKDGKRYIQMVVDDFSRYSFVSFLREKSKTIEHLKVPCTRIQVEKGNQIMRIRNDRGREFNNIEIYLFCESKGIKHEYSTPRTPQQNGVVERKNCVLQEMARVMINMHDTLMQFWAEAINTTCYNINKVFLRPATKKTSYELWTRRKLNPK